MAGVDAFDRKLAVATWARELGLPLTMNVVLHRENLHSIAQIIEFAERCGADRLELANTQHLDWALINRRELLPTHDQPSHARAIAHGVRQRLSGRMEIVSVRADYCADFPRVCMGRWGRRYILISPDGMVLPCHAAHTLPGLHFERVVERSLRDIWEHSKRFMYFRGESWMPEPCRSCERRSIDFGGCRCQAHHLTGDPAATDPACRFSPHHSLIQRDRADAEGDDFPVAFQHRS